MNRDCSFTGELKGLYKKPLIYIETKYSPLQNKSPSLHSPQFCSISKPSFTLILIL